MLPVGVDGCRAGWLAVMLPRDGPKVEVFRSFDEVLSNACGALVLVDVPIGLPSAPHGVRKCDIEARKLLGKRLGSRVFPAPSRQAVEEFSGGQTGAAVAYRRLSEVNRAAVGKYLSKQAYAIIPRIADVDTMLQTDEWCRSRVGEIHPELSFAALNGWSAVREPKDSPEGQSNRLDVIRRHLPSAEDVSEETLGRFKRREVQKDDILDALAAALTAHIVLASRIYRVPENPETDTRGFPMEMIVPFKPPL